MTPRTRKAPRSEPQDVGTLWTLRREEYTARCSLFFCSSEWELRVVMEQDTLLSRRCGTTADAFELAEHWRRGLAEHGWQIIPMSAHAAASRDDGTAAAL